MVCNQCVDGYAEVDKYENSQFRWSFDLNRNVKSNVLFVK